MGVPQILLETLEDLVDDDLKTFRWHLTLAVLDGCKPIPKSRLDGASRTTTVSRMIESYGEESAVNVTVEILKQMKFNGTAEELKRKYAGGQTAPPSTSSSAVAPPAAPAAPAATAAPVSNMAQQGGVVIAPILAGGTTGVWNVNISK